MAAVFVNSLAVGEASALWLSLRSKVDLARFESVLPDKRGTGHERPYYPLPLKGVYLQIKNGVPANKERVYLQINAGICKICLVAEKPFSIGFLRLCRLAGQGYGEGVPPNKERCTSKKRGCTCKQKRVYLHIKVRVPANKERCTSRQKRVYLHIKTTGKNYQFAGTLGETVKVPCSVFRCMLVLLFNNRGWVIRGVGPVRGGRCRLVPDSSAAGLRGRKCG